MRFLHAQRGSWRARHTSDSAGSMAAARQLEGSNRVRTGRTRPRLRPQLEQLESRTLLSVSHGYARIINGQVLGPPRGGSDPFPSVGIVGDELGGFCSGTLIGPRQVLTAGHCLDGLDPRDGRFTVGADTYFASQIYVHPNYRPWRLGTDAANDIGIMVLHRVVDDIEPSRINRRPPRLGQTLILVGYGAGGTGPSGHDYSFGTKRVGRTTIEGISPRIIRWRFDNDSESNTAPGDSGGPAFIERNSRYFIAGITSGGTRADAAIGDSSLHTSAGSTPSSGALAGRLTAVPTRAPIMPATTTPTCPGQRPRHWLLTASGRA